jgi:hypothetical protein
MALALEPPQQCQVLRLHPRLTFQSGPYSYTIEREVDRVIYRVTDGRQTISEPLLAAFGLGDAGQTYLIRHQGSYYESRVSFFNDVQKLDITLGHSRATPESLDGALGKKLSPDEATLCFACHSTASVTGATLQLEHLIPGITCEGCHGPGANHIAMVGSRKPTDLSIFNPARLTAGDLVEFCGSCHRGLFQVELMGISGIQTVRFQPYRLTNSRCFDPRDPRISCLACHDPHQGRRRDANFYDGKCIACHSARSRRLTSSGPGARTCRVGRGLCTGCHMAKRALPGGHLKFTDHEIGIMRDLARVD